MKKMTQSWKILLGKEQAQQYTHALVEEQGLRILGSVSRGSQFGALAQAADGRYVQINGDHVTPLSQAQIDRAVRRARSASDNARRLPRQESAMAKANAPVVTIKRRRVVNQSDPDRPESRGQRSW